MRIVELPKEGGNFKLGSYNAPEFIETSERIDEMLVWKYLTKEDVDTQKTDALNK